MQNKAISEKQNMRFLENTMTNLNVNEVIRDSQDVDIHTYLSI